VKQNIDGGKHERMNTPDQTGRNFDNGWENWKRAMSGLIQAHWLFGKLPCGKKRGVRGAKDIHGIRGGGGGCLATEGLETPNHLFEMGSTPVVRKRLRGGVGKPLQAERARRIWRSAEA